MKNSYMQIFVHNQPRKEEAPFLTRFKPGVPLARFLWACPNCIDKERKNNDLEFVAHLDECSAIVSGWSKWKQMLFGRK